MPKGQVPSRVCQRSAKSFGEKPGARRNAFHRRRPGGICRYTVFLSGLDCEPLLRVLWNTGCPFPAQGPKFPSSRNSEGEHVQNRGRLLKSFVRISSQARAGAYQSVVGGRTVRRVSLQAKVGLLCKRSGNIVTMVLTLNGDLAGCVCRPGW